ncbi:hypothetical protein HNO89_004321 [Sporosarcina luteola]|nr:hypothetical protein [Sporosarcina luteola]
MKIRVAVFGSGGFMEKIVKVPIAKQIEITPFVYENPIESPRLVKEAKGFHVLLFTGPVPYYLSRQEIVEKNLPALFIPFDEYVISLTLHHVRNERGALPQQLSFDIQEQQMIDNVFADMNLKTDSIYIKEYKDLIEKNPTQFYEELVEFHRDLWLAGKIDLVITSINAVYEKLRLLQIPCSRMVMPEKNIIDTMHTGYTYGELNRSKKAQIAVGFISIKQYKEYIQERGKLAGQEVVLELHQLLLHFAKDMNASLHYLNNEQYLLFGTRGPIEAMAKQEEGLSILRKISEALPIKVGIGFGFGIDANDAEENAQIALAYAMEPADECNCYIVTDNKQVIGPIEKQSKTFLLRSEDEYYLTLATKTSLSVSNISKIIEFWEMRSHKGFTAGELADYLELSRRSSSRMLKKLADNGIAAVIGEEQPHAKGRPRSVYQLNL